MGARLPDFKPVMRIASGPAVDAPLIADGPAACNDLWRTGGAGETLSLRRT